MGISFFISLLLFFCYNRTIMWGTKRQIKIIAAILFLFIVWIIILLYPRFNKPPTCFDNKQNQDETGVDCGGVCQALCLSEVNDVSIKWARSFPTTETVYNTVAYIENKNIDAGVMSVPYSFQFYNADNQLISERQGKTYIAPNSASAIFEQAVIVSLDNLPQYTTFKFTAPRSWARVDRRVRDIKLVSQNEQLINTTTKPRFNATLVNKSLLYGAKNINVVIILYDANDNAIGVSNTYLDHLGPGESSSIYYTWQRPFSVPIVRYEIIPRFNPFDVSF